MKIDFTRHKCFYCKDRIEGGEEYTCTLNTADGKHEVKMCATCAKDFNEIMIDLEGVVNERPKSI